MRRVSPNRRNRSSLGASRTEGKLLPFSASLRRFSPQLVRFSALTLTSSARTVPAAPIREDMGMEEKKIEEKKFEYQAPEIVDYGDLAELTAGLATGTHIDAAFPSGTPFSQLTFS